MNPQEPPREPLFRACLALEIDIPDEVMDAVLSRPLDLGRPLESLNLHLP
jgi:hypothetical protein